VVAELPSVRHPLGCHRHRVPDRLLLDKLSQILVFGCATAARAGYQPCRPALGNAAIARAGWSAVRGRATAGRVAGTHDRLPGL
jgi:hypothetical protein